MEKAAPAHSSDLSDAERQQLSDAIRQNLVDGVEYMGAQLGGLVRRHLTDPDIQRRFGGLRSLLDRHFRSEIRWQGRGEKGLDDVYKVCLSGGHSETDVPTWRPVPRELVLWLWPAVSNPTIQHQFAWSARDASLLHAPNGVPLTEGLTSVARLAQADYKAIAAAFADSREESKKAKYLKAIDGAEWFKEFTAALRQEQSVADWEVFRIDHVLRAFAERLEAAGATKAQAAGWADQLRASQQQGWAQRRQSPSVNPSLEARAIASRRAPRSQTPEARELAAKAIQFLSDAQVAQLRLPLGSIVSALRSFLDNN